MDTVTVKFWDGTTVEAVIVERYPDGDARVRLPDGRHVVVTLTEAENE
jgi:hypothetical protein